MENNLINNTVGLLKGIKLATDSIRQTYGPYGVNACIQCDEAPYNKIVNDAYTIIESLQTNNKEEKLGLNLFKELMDKQNNISGDGRKTTAIIADELITLGSKLDIPRIKLKQELDALIPLVEAKIDEQKHLITEDDIEAVATVASESSEMGKLLGEIYKQIGKDGIIHLESSGTPVTSYLITEGVRFADATYLSPAMVHDEQAIKEGSREIRAVYENTTILVTKKKINHLNEINPLLETLVRQGKKDLVIFTHDMDSAVSKSLLRVHTEKDEDGNKKIPLNILIIKAPVVWRDYIFEDFAKCVGATIVEDSTGLDLKTLPLSALGTCGKIITDSKETIILETQDISEHISDLKLKGDNDSLLRLSWLATKTCNLYLGANSENDLYYKSMKCKDAINSSRLALQDGVVKGCGLCLVDVVATLPVTEIGIVLTKALLAPYRQLCINAKVDSIILPDNVLDASLVLKKAVRSAIGLASTALTIGVAIPFLPKTEEELRLLTATKSAF